MTQRLKRALAVAFAGLFLIIASAGSASAAGCELDLDASTVGKVKAAVDCTVNTVEQVAN